MTRSRPTSSPPLSVGSRAIAVLCLLAWITGCAGGPFGSHPRVSREEAIRRCIERVPAESVLYADRFAACMESYGWEHSSRAE